MRKINLFQLIIFLAAFLLFQIEFIIAKILLPLYGGSYLVWGGCIVFFQAVLLLGYVYAHFAIQRWGIDRYRWVHAGLVLLPLLFLPGGQLTSISINSQLPLAVDVFWQLLKNIGSIFFVLATFSIVLQAWVSSSELEERTNPYALYSVSNLGSLSALLSYPFLFESLFDLKIQLNIWRAGYFILAVLQVASLAFIGVKKEKRQRSTDTVITIDGEDVSRWLLLGMTGSIMFLSVTNIITAEVAPIPLLWMMPLFLYILSFVLNFKERPWCPRWINEKLYLTMGGSVLFYFLNFKRSMIPFVIELFFYAFFLFHICMFCQRELYQTKPGGKAHLTFFYAIISLGSFIGGFVVNWILPLTTTSFLEYFVGLILLSGSLLIGKKREPINFHDLRWLMYGVILLIIWPMVYQGYNVFGLIILFVCLKFVFSEFNKKKTVLLISLILIMALTPLLDAIWALRFFIERHRNYYGLYRVYDDGNTRFLLHGTTLHGAQYLDAKYKKTPLTYYHYSTPAGEILRSSFWGFKTIGIVGLGTGTLASYIQEDQSLDFFELDPDVYKLATRYFTYLKDASGRVNCIFGDAKLSLQKQPAQKYDLLIIDAFSSDSIPIHLLSVEALQVYQRVLKRDGLILFHISNRYLELSEILAANGAVSGGNVYLKENGEISYNRFDSSWVAITWDRQQSQILTSKLKWKSIKEGALARKIRPWTDTYSNILSRIKIKVILDSIRYFKIFYW